MSAVATKCAGCGDALSLDVPEGDSAGARLARALARTVRCDTCLAREEREEAERDRVVTRDGHRAACRLPKRYRGISLDDFEPRTGQNAALAAAREWASTKDAGGLMLTGDAGVGKTRLAAAACWTRLERWPCVYVEVGRTMQRLGGSFNDDGRREAIRVFSGTSPVVFDDLDKTRDTEFAKEAIFSAIDARYQAEVPILVTTNLLPEQIGEHYGEGVKSRLIEYCRVQAMAGGDQRLVAAKERDVAAAEPAGAFR